MRPPSAADVVAAAAVGRAAVEPFVDDDWTMPAGDLAWSVRETLAHVTDALGWYAAHLAYQSPRRLRFDLHVHDDASHADVLDVLSAASAMLAHVAQAAPPTARGYHPAGRSDVSGFLAMACDEILVHCWDAAHGLGGTLTAPEQIAERVVRRLFPWAPHGVPPWQALLWANGRIALPGREQLDSDWHWHCAPLTEWDTRTSSRRSQGPVSPDQTG